MKKTLTMWVLALLGTATLGYAQQSEKAYKWSSADEVKLTSMCLTDIVAPIKQELDASLALDENKFCGCMLEKVKVHYRSYEAVRTSDNSELGEKIGRECAMEALSFTGKSASSWSEEDNQKLDEFCFDVVLPMVDEKLTEDIRARFNKDTFCSCMHEKVTQKFDSFKEFIGADDEDFNVSLGQDCGLEAMKSR